MKCNIALLLVLRATKVSRQRSELSLYRNKENGKYHANFKYSVGGWWKRNDSPLNASEDFHKSLETKLHWHYVVRKLTQI